MKLGATTIRREFSSLFELPNAASRITSMEGMRGYAVLLVFLVHHHTLFSHLLPPSSLLYGLSEFGHDIGHSGVDLFFVLSGYLIYGHVFQKAPGYFSYLRKRVRRIYPVFFTVFCFYLLASFWIPSISKLPHSPFNAVVYLIENLLFLPGIFPIDAMITVSWSLSYEFFFYLCVPLVVGATGMRRWNHSRRTAFFLGLLLLHFAGYYFGVLPHIRLSLFIAGILLFETIDSRRTKGRLPALGEFLAIGLYAAAILALCLFEFSDTRIAFHPHFPNRASVYWSAFLSVGLFGLTLYTISYKGLLRALFNAPPLRWLGNMSYSYFLCHAMVLNGAAFALRGGFAPPTLSPAMFLVLLILNLALTLAGSLVLFTLVEKPFSLLVKPSRAARSVAPESGAQEPPQELSAVSAATGNPGK